MIVFQIVAVHGPRVLNGCMIVVFSCFQIVAAVFCNALC